VTSDIFAHVTIGLLICDIVLIINFSQLLSIFCIINWCSINVDDDDDDGDDDDKDVDDVCLDYISCGADVCGSLFYEGER